jgi:hypothetical protein
VVGPIGSRAGRTEVIADRAVGETVSFPGTTDAVNANFETRSVVVVSEGGTLADLIGNHDVAWDIASLSHAWISSY